MCQPEFPYWVKALANLDNKPSLEKTLRSNCYCWMKSRWCKGTPGSNMNWLAQFEETNKWRYFQLIRHFRFTCTGCSSSGVHHCINSTWHHVPSATFRPFPRQCSTHTALTQPFLHRQISRTAVMLARCVAVDDKLHYVVSFAMARGALVQYCTCTSPRLHWHLQHNSCTSGEPFGQIKQTYRYLQV